MKILIEDLNELQPDQFESKHIISTKRTYVKHLREKGISSYYFIQKPTEEIDFVNSLLISSNPIEDLIEDQTVNSPIIDTVIQICIDNILRINLPVTISHVLFLISLKKSQLLQQYPDRGS